VSRGDPHSKTEIAARQAAIAAEITVSGDLGNKEEFADSLGISRTTLWRDLMTLQTQYVEGSREDIRAYKAAQLQALYALEDHIAAGTIETDVGNSLLKVREAIARLLGLNEPDRKLTVNVDVTNTSVQYQFLEHSHGLKADQLQEVFKFMDGLPRTSVTIADCFTPQLKEPDEQE
jgi:hypothetical protein